MKSVLENKRGGFIDIFLFMILGLVITVVCVIFVYMGNQIDDKLDEAFLEMDQENKTSGPKNLTQVKSETFGKLPTQLTSLYWITAFLMLGMIIAIFIGSFLVTVRPVFFVPYIFVMIIAIIVAAEISNGYETIMSNADLAGTFTNFVGSNFIFAHLPLWITIIGFAGGTIMFINMKRRQVQIG